jgi:hypothetical protein
VIGLDAQKKIVEAIVDLLQESERHCDDQARGQQGEEKNRVTPLLRCVLPCENGAEIHLGVIVQ